MTHSCPYCGGPYDPPPLKTDLDRNRIYINGHPVKVLPGVAEVLDVLLNDFPNSVTATRLIDRLWGATGGPDTAENVVKVYISKLRKCLEQSDWRVVNGRRTGGRSKYQLMKADFV